MNHDFLGKLALSFQQALKSLKLVLLFFVQNGISRSHRGHSPTALANSAGGFMKNSTHMPSVP